MGRAVALAAVVVVATTVVVIAYARRLKKQGTLAKWKEAAAMIVKFAESMDMGQEINLLGYKMPIAINMGLLAAVQRSSDARVAARTGDLGGEALAARFAKGAHYMKFASAAYGSALMLIFGLIPQRTKAQLSTLSYVTRLIRATRRSCSW